MRLSERATFKRPTYATGSGGRQTVTWSILYRRVPIELQPLASRETVIAYDRKNWFANYWAYLEKLTGIKEGDRFYLDNSREFEIKLVMSDSLGNRTGLMKLAVSEIAKGE